MTGTTMTASEPAGRPKAAPAEPVTVYYDGACPLCSAEIAHYRTRPGADRIEWIDANDCPAEVLPTGLSREAALARFHVRDAEGRLIAGGRAFAVVWSELPGYARFGRLFRAGPLAWAIDRAYELFLRVRPRVQRLTRRLFAH